MAQMTDNLENESAKSENALVVEVLSSTSQFEKTVLLEWLTGLIEIRNSSKNKLIKAKEALIFTQKAKVIWPTIKIVSRKSKNYIWDDRSTASRMALGAGGVGLTFFAGKSAGIAALGSAIGVPLWIVFAGGAALAGLLIEELQKSIQTSKLSETTYSVSDAEEEQKTIVAKKK